MDENNANNRVTKVSAATPAAPFGHWTHTAPCEKHSAAPSYAPYGEPWPASFGQSPAPIPSPDDLDSSSAETRPLSSFSPSSSSYSHSGTTKTREPRKSTKSPGRTVGQQISSDHPISQTPHTSSQHPYSGLAQSQEPMPPPSSQQVSRRSQTGYAAHVQRAMALPHTNLNPQVPESTHHVHSAQPHGRMLAPQANMTSQQAIAYPQQGYITERAKLPHHQTNSGTVGDSNQENLPVMPPSLPEQHQHQQLPLQRLQHGYSSQQLHQHVPWHPQSQQSQQQHQNLHQQQRHTFGQTSEQFIAQQQERAFWSCQSSLGHRGGSVKGHGQHGRDGGDPPSGQK